MSSNNDVVLLTFEIFGHARNHGKKFPKSRQTSVFFSGMVNYEHNIISC